MKALLVEYCKGNHPQATREVRKTEVDHIFAKGQYDPQRSVAFQHVSR